MGTGVGREERTGSGWGTEDVGKKLYRIRQNDPHRSLIASFTLLGII